MRAQLHKQVQSTHKFSRPCLRTRMIATNSATLLRAAGAFFTGKLCDLGDAHIQAMCSAIQQRRKKILNFARSSDGELRAISQILVLPRARVPWFVMPRRAEAAAAQRVQAFQVARVHRGYGISDWVRLTSTSASHGPWWTPDARLERGYGWNITRSHETAARGSWCFWVRVT